MNLSFTGLTNTTAQVGGVPSDSDVPSINFSVTATDLLVTSGPQVYSIKIFSRLQNTGNISTLPGGTQGVAYSVSLTSLTNWGGNSTAYSWSLGTVTPTAPWLSLSSGGSLSGTPLAGTYSVPVQLNDGFATINPTFTLVISPAPLVLQTTPLPPGEASAPYPPPNGGGVALAATGGVQPYHWAVTGLPAGLTFDATTGAISGTLAANATTSTNVVITVTDSASVSVSSPALTLTVTPGPSIAAAVLPNGEVTAPYPQQTLAAAGGSGSGYTLTVTSGSLPAGLVLNSTTGAITGTPTAAGPSNFTVQVTDSAGGKGTQNFTLTIVAAPTITTAPALPSGTVGVAYTTVTLAASDGTPPYLWSIITGSLPPGLSLDATTGTITGTPTQSGPSNFTVQVKDAKQVTATKQFSITIAAGLTITTAPVLPSGTVGIGYSVFMSAAGGTPPYTWSVVSGSLPNGLTLVSSTGEIRGFPSSSGSFPFTVKITDSASVTATKDFTLTVAGALTFTTPPILPSAAAGVPYSQPLAASGGNPPYSFNITAGALPNGLSLSTVSNLITGTPVSSGTFTFTIQVKDSNSVTVSQVFTLTVSAGLVITTPPQLPQGAVNSPYSQALAAVGGTAPYTWKLVQGTLPLGLSLSGGTIAGTPTANGSSTFTIQVMDNAGVTASQQFTLTIGAGLAITTPPALPPGTVGQAYGPFTLARVGGTSPYTWAVSAGSMPAGLSLSLNGIITGTPAAAGAFTVTLQVKDSTGATAAQTFTISIVQPPQLNVAGVPQTSPAGQQISSLGLALTSPYPLDITGLITLSFQPDAVAGAVDPAMQFSTGGLTASYTIPANSTDAVFSNSLKKIGLQTGTVSGTITLTFTLAAAGGDLPGFQRTIAISRTAPVIQSVKLVRTSAGLEVHVIGFSPPRDLTEADLTFTAAPGATLQTTSVTQNISNVATAWYQGTASAQYGSLLMLVLPFTASQGSVDAVGSVSVVMKSAEGSSASVSGTF